MKFNRLFIGIPATLLLAACATEEFRRAEAECADQARATHPVVLEDRVIRQSRKIWVPDGSTICESTVTSTSNDSSRKTTVSGGSRDSHDSRNSRNGKDPRDSAEPGVAAQRKQPSQKVSTVRERTNGVSMEMTQAVQVCRPGTREALEYYDEPVKVDVNADARHSVISSCTAALCLQRFGNGNCKK